MYYKDKSLEELFEIAQKYGNIRLFQCDSDRTFSAVIEFMTIKNTKLEAKSGFRHKDIRTALIAVIEAAQQIVDSVQGIAKQIESHD